MKSSDFPFMFNVRFESTATASNKLHRFEKLQRHVSRLATHKKAKDFLSKNCNKSAVKTPINQTALMFTSNDIRRRNYINLIRLAWKHLNRDTSHSWDVHNYGLITPSNTIRLIKGRSNLVAMVTQELTAKRNPIQFVTHNSALLIWLLKAQVIVHFFNLSWLFQIQR